MQRRVVPDLVSNQTLASLPPSATVRDAAQVMAERHVGAILVAVDGRLQGIFTERDLLSRVVAAGLDPDDTVLGGVMTPNPDTVAPNDTALDALRRMTACGYRHLPVLDGARMVGIVSIRDLYASVNRELAEDLEQREAFIFDTGYGTG